MIAGLTAAGKTTQATCLATALGLRYVSGSDVRAELLKLSENGSSQSDFWSAAQGMCLDQARLRSPSGAELSVESTLVQIARGTGSCVFDVWALPWVFREQALCIYLRSSKLTRAMRFQWKLGIDSIETALARIDEKDRLAKEFFLSAYGIDIECDLSPFDIVVDSEHGQNTREDSRPAISQVIQHLVASVLSGDTNALATMITSAGCQGPAYRIRVSDTLLKRLAS